MSSGSYGNTVSGGTGNDTVSLGGGTSYGRVLQYASDDGNDIIIGFNSNDTLKITSGSVSSSVTSGNNLIVNIGSGSITFMDYSGDINISEMASSADLFEDDNFVSGTARIEDISEITADNYSVSKFEPTDYNSLAQDDRTFLAYSKDDK